MHRILQRLLLIRYSLWFTPFLVVATAIILASAAIEIDTRIGEDIFRRWPRLFGASADGARALLETVSGAMITVAALTFSITVLVLTMAASQYTPRVIRNFMGSRSTQLVFGAFTGIFCYCLVVLRVVRGEGEDFVPSVSITMAMLLAFLGVAVLLYFIHHIASSIQVSAIASDIAAETVKMVDATFGQCKEEEMTRNRNGSAVAACRFVVQSAHTGYLRSVDLDALSEYAAKKQLVVKIECRIGDFVIESGLLAHLDRPADEEMQRELNRFFSVGHYRTIEQDIGEGIQQLSDIALHALSPGVNDTSSALLCIDYLSSIFARMAPLQLKPRHCYHDGKILVFAPGTDFEEILDTTFGNIQQSGKGNFPVYMRLLAALCNVGAQARGTRHSFIVSQVHLLHRRAHLHLTPDNNLAQFERKIQEALARLQQGSPSAPVRDA